jgi:hypothetical protein
MTIPGIKPSISHLLGGDGAWCSFTWDLCCYRRLQCHEVVVAFFNKLTPLLPTGCKWVRDRYPFYWNKH